MHQKNIWFGGIAIALLIILVVVGFFVFRTAAPKQESMAEKSEVTAVKRTIQMEDDISKIDIEYPQITNVSKRVNDDIQKIIDTRVTEFKKIARENEQARIDTNKQLPANEQRPARPDANDYWYSLYVRYSAGVMNAQKVSMVFFIDEYSGGAHGNKSFISYNYDLAQNKEIKLADLFPNEPDYLQRISAYAYADIAKQMKTNNPDMEVDLSWIKTGTEPQLDNFSNFTIGENSITLYIPPYQVAAYAYGDFQVTMPLN